MTEQIKILYEKVRSVMLDFEKVKETIDSISSKNILHIKLKEKLKEYSNTCLADMLIFSDLLYQLLDTYDSDEMEIVLQAFTEADDDLPI